MIRTVRRWSALFALGLCACAGPAEQDPAAGASLPDDVLLITVDTFRADRAGCLGHPGGLTPSLDRRLRGAFLARHAFAPAPLTAVSHASMLTGLEPPSHGVRENAFSLPEALPSLAGSLAENGFRTGAFIAAFPLDSRFGFARGFESFDEKLHSPGSSAGYYAERPASEVTDAALTWLEAVPSGERAFLWAHFFDPHHPRNVPRPWRKLPAVDDYDREIRRMDCEIGRLLREAAEVRRPRRAITAILSDHGEGLGDHGESSHGVLVHEETMRALFGIAGSAELGPGIFEGVVRFSDLFPTLMDVLDLEIPSGDGRSLARGAGDEVGAYGETYYPMIHYRWSPLLSWRDERWTYVESPNPELYDRHKDPGEEENVIASHPDIAARMAARIAARAEEPALTEADPLDAESREKLLALGYVSGGGGAEVDRSKDPKKLVGVANALFRGITLFSEGNARAALSFLQSAYRVDPENVSVLFYLANCLRTLGDSPTAMAYYRRAIEIDPKAADAYAHLAILLFEAGRREEAFRILEDGLDGSPDSFSLLMTSGDLQGDVQEVSSAESFYERAQQVEPRRVEPWVRLAEIAEARGDRAAASKRWAAALEVDASHSLIPQRIRNELARSKRAD